MHRSVSEPCKRSPAVTRTAFADKARTRIPLCADQSRWWPPVRDTFPAPVLACPEFNAPDSTYAAPVRDTRCLHRLSQDKHDSRT